MKAITFRYLVPLFLATYSLQLGIFAVGGPASRGFTVLAPIMMFFPGIFALVFLRWTPESWRSVGWRLQEPKILLLAALYPSITALICLALIQAFALGASPHLAISGWEVDVLRGAFVLGSGEQSLPWFALNLLVTSCVIGAVNGLVTVGEEVGWRGFLQSRMIDRFGGLKGVAILGAIWGFWHTPLIMQGYNYPETPILGAFVLFPLYCVLLSFVFAWLTIRGRSVWPAVLAHGGINAFHGSLVDGISFNGPRLPADLLILGVLAAVALPAAASLSRVPGSGPRRP